MVASVYFMVMVLSHPSGMLRQMAVVWAATRWQATRIWHTSDLASHPLLREATFAPVHLSKEIATPTVFLNNVDCLLVIEAA